MVVTKQDIKETEQKLREASESLKDLVIKLYQSEYSHTAHKFEDSFCTDIDLAANMVRLIDATALRFDGKAFKYADNADSGSGK